VHRPRAMRSMEIVAKQVRGCKRFLTGAKLCAGYAFVALLKARCHFFLVPSPRREMWCASREHQSARLTSQRRALCQNLELLRVASKPRAHALEIGAVGFRNKLDPAGATYGGWGVCGVLPNWTSAG
jgi:hypothetical protein